MRIGLVSFSTGPDVLVTPTVDRGVLQEGIDLLPEAGTAIGDGLGVAVQVVKSSVRRRAARTASARPRSSCSPRAPRCIETDTWMSDFSITDAMVAAGHEQVVFAADGVLGLRAVIAIHSTALGPSLGGIRFWRYASERDAVRDALRLSEAMTLKAAAAGLHQGGGKAVVLVDDPDRPRSEDLLRALGRAIDELGGRYIAAEDVGATRARHERDLRETPWVTGVDEAAGGSGDPSPVTASGVLHAMRAVCLDVFGDASPAGRTVVVQGAGHVGAQLVRLFATRAPRSVLPTSTRRASRGGGACVRRQGARCGHGARAAVRRARARARWGACSRTTSSPDCDAEPSSVPRTTS